MKKAISAKQKRGRPATGVRPMIGFRADDVTRTSIIWWAENQPDKPTLSDAIRRLVELGLSVDKPLAQTSARKAAKAKRLAGDAIDDLADQKASTSEKHDRKRDLLSGPEEFRDVRVDHKKKR